jgi:23S rRNA (adenine2503-C2)-methyltransferase
VSTEIPQDAAAKRYEARGRRWTLSDGRVDLLSLDREAMEKFVVEDLGERTFRARQIFRWLHDKLAGSFEEMTDLSKKLRHRLEEQAAIVRPSIDDVKVSSDGTRKYQLRTWDDHVIEAVFIPDASGPGRNALCVSSQVGCAMGCRFCATAAIQLKRHLSPGEIAGQLYVVTQDVNENVDLQHRAENQPEGPGKLPRPVTNIVYMGMGEPLHNFAGVVGSSDLITHDDGLGYSSRRLTVSTSGLVPAIERLGEQTDLQIAISLNATTDEVRSDIMPVNKKWRIEDLLQACRDFPLKARRRITFEYVMLAGVNDSDEDARRLIQLVGDLKCKVNLIPFNPHPLSPYERPSNTRVDTFQKILEAAHVSTYRRTTRGLDIDAACGMLGAKKLAKARDDERPGALPVVP